MQYWSSPETPKIASTKILNHLPTYILLYINVEFLHYAQRQKLAYVPTCNTLMFRIFFVCMLESMMCFAVGSFNDYFPLA